MIEGIKKTKTEHTLQLLEESPFQFHLTGSRAFGTHHQNSDWDFFVQDNEDESFGDGTIRVWLTSKGFKMEAEPMYESSNTAYVYRLGEVHIQVVHDAEMKSLAQNLLKGSGLLREHFTKQTIKKLWDLTFAALEIGYDARKKIISG